MRVIFSFALAIIGACAASRKTTGTTSASSGSGPSSSSSVSSTSASSTGGCGGGGMNGTATTTATSGSGGMASSSSSSVSGGGAGGGGQTYSQCILFDDAACVAKSPAKTNAFYCDQAPWPDCDLLMPGNPSPWGYWCCPEVCAHSGGTAWCAKPTPNLYVCSQDPPPIYEPGCKTNQMSNALCCP